MTVRDLLTRSLKLLGVLATGESAEASMMQDALTATNSMIDSWKNVGLMVYENQAQPVVLISGQQTYTIGIGGDLNIDRPISINRANFINAGIEYKIDILTESEWSEIPDKDTTTSIPLKMYFNPSFPFGKLSFWPKPADNLTINLYFPKPVSRFSSVNSIVELPPGYEDLIVYGAADRIGAEYGKELTPRQNQILNETRADIMRKNTVEEFMTSDLITTGQGRVVDIYGGGYR